MARKRFRESIGAAAGKLENAARKARVEVSDSTVAGPSPNAATNLAMADIALRGGSVLARRAVQRAFLGTTLSTRKTNKILSGRSVTEKLLHTALARVALSSVPGAIVVGGALVAKTLYDRSKAAEAAVEGKQKLEEMAAEGEEHASS
jgi:hypothetical protein